MAEDTLSCFPKRQKEDFDIDDNVTVHAVANIHAVIDYKSEEGVEP